MMGRTISRIWLGFWQLADPKIWLASTVPMTIAAALTYAHTKTMPLYWFVISLGGIYLIEIGKNAVNELVDYFSGVDLYVTEDKRNPFSGGKKTLVDHKLTVAETVGIAILTFVGALGIGWLIIVEKEPLVLVIGLIGLAISIMYSLPPFKLSYHGLGEVAVGMTYGPLLVSGMYAVLTGTLGWEVVIIGIPLAFLITNVLWINQYPDYEADLRGGKRNWLVRMGKVKGIKVYAGLYIAAYISLIALAFIEKNPFWLTGLISIPLAVQSLKIARRYYDDIPKLIAANAKTIQVYIITGVAMLIAALL